MATVNAAAPKGATQKPQSKGFTGIKSGFAVILLCFIIAESLYVFGAGHFSNFNGTEGLEGLPFKFFHEEELHPNGIIGTVYMGGFIVPIIWTMLLTVLALSVERFFAIKTATGKGAIPKFAAEIKAALRNNDLEKAVALCNKQQGSVANVVLAALNEYKAQQTTDVELEKKVQAIQKSVEEATALEMPMMQENLPIIGTLVTLGTLIGLLGTVLGMIKSFSSMAGGEGGTDSSALAIGISEALVNTASGIATGAAAVISYSFYTNKIDRLTFAIDELGFTIVETFKTTQK